MVASCKKRQASADEARQRAAPWPRTNSREPIFSLRKPGPQRLDLLNFSAY
jgi:hypothetical protein